MKRTQVLCAILFLLVLSGCAAHYTPEAIEDPYGFFSGIWHGAIAGLTITINILSWLLSLVGISLLSDIQIMGRPNTGLFYYTGFFAGFLWLKLI